MDSTAISANSLDMMLRMRTKESTRTTTMPTRFLLSVLFIVVGNACAPSSANLPRQESATPTPKVYEFDREKARAISDSMVDALIKNDRPILFSKMERAAREYYDQASFDKIVDMMLTTFGSPIEAKFKKAEQGRKWGTDGYDKPMLKHWYAVRTSKFDYGSHFIFVEIVPDEEGYASSGVSTVNFPMGFPEDMQ